MGYITMLFVFAAFVVGLADANNNNGCPNLYSCDDVFQEKKSDQFPDGLQYCNGCDWTDCCNMSTAGIIITVVVVLASIAAIVGCAYWCCCQAGQCCNRGGGGAPPSE